MATDYSTLAWRIPWTEEPDRVQSMGPQSRTSLSDFTFLTFLPHQDFLYTTPNSPVYPSSIFALQVVQTVYRWII